MKHFVWLEFMVGFLLAIYGAKDDVTWAWLSGVFLVSSAVLFVTGAVWKKEQK